MLLGQQITVHTDHENLTYKNFNSDRVMRWRLYIEEYSPDLQYIKGTHNVVADALNRLDNSEEPIKDNTEMFMTYMECLTSDGNSLEFHPLNYQHLQIAQTKDIITMKILKLPKTLYHLKNFHGGGITPWYIIKIKQ